MSSFLKSARDLKNEILINCGELSDGTSQFEDLVMTKLNNVYRSLIFGGNEFGIDVNEPWIWAQRKRPILFQLMPKEEPTVTLTNGSFSGAFSVAPTTSMEGRYLKIPSRADFYRIASHTAGQTAFQIDQVYLDESGSFGAYLYKLDYDLFDENIVIDSTMNKLDFTEDGTTFLTATITKGVYTTTSLCAEIKTQMEAQGNYTYDVTFDSISRKFKITQNGGTIFSLLFGSGANALRSMSQPLGYDVTDLTGALFYETPYALSGIVRLSKPISIYRDSQNFSASPKDSDKIFMIDDNTFLREYPMSRLHDRVPDKFCQISQSPEGLWSIRMNGSVLDNPIRAEAYIIPPPRKLFDNVNSFSMVPDAYNDFLVFAASHYVLSDKEDTKSEYYYKLAQAKLQSMISYNRKGLAQAGAEFGRLIPRGSHLYTTTRKFL